MFALFPCLEVKLRPSSTLVSYSSLKPNLDRENPNCPKAKPSLALAKTQKVCSLLLTSYTACRERTGCIMYSTTSGHQGISSPPSEGKKYHIRHSAVYTAQTGLPYFDRAAVIAIGSWYYDSPLPSMGGDSSFCCCGVNIGSIYKQ